MADEDEIDVLGDFSLDSLLSKNENGITSCYDNSLMPNSSELLGCDYTLNPTWLIDHGVNANSDIWYSNSANDFSAEDSPNNTSLGFDEVICSENKTTEEPGWTEEEKNLLEKGLEIFGKSSVRLSQFIGSKSPLQTKFYLNHVYTGNTNTISLNSGDVDNLQQNKNEVSSVFNMSDIIEDAQIPASIEEVIAAVSTAKPTVTNIRKKASTKKTQPKYPSKPSFRQSVLKNNLHSLPRKKRDKNFRLLNKRREGYTIIEDRGQKKIEGNDGIQNEHMDKNVYRKEVIPVSSGEELIKISKENVDTESDTDIEIDIDETNTDAKSCEKEFIEKQKNLQEFKSDHKNNVFNEINSHSYLEDITKNIDKQILEFLNSMDIPTKEYVLEARTILDVEKFVHSEFFEGRSVKTPSRYLKIRNYIIDYWKVNKPTYCTKTSVRIGLKNCGDVNCIGRIHQYLEQTGVINFGCPQVQYLRPLLQIVIANHTMQAKEKPKKEHSTGAVQQRCDVVRARMKKKYNNDGEGGYTMIHNENGEVIDTTVINHDKQTKPRTYRKNIKLVYCKSFTTEYPAPYSVELNISALLMIDLHAHSALIEVMGLLGGIFNSDTRVLQIVRYVPCRGIDHSNTHCDMCPVSQSEASEILQSEGLEVIGWFHSHPTFYPNPSLQDIDTQLSMQEYLSNEFSPFVGVILSPFRTFTNTFMSEYRCLIVDKDQDNKDGGGIPYKFVVNLTCNGFSVDTLLKLAQNVLCMENNVPSEFVVDFSKPYFQDNSITYLDKFLASIKVHLARCTEINKMTCDAVVQGLLDICIGISSSKQTK